MNYLLLTLALAINYLAFYLTMPNISVLMVLMFILIIPGIINGYFYHRDRENKNIFIYPIISTVFYVISAYFLETSGKIIEFANRANVNTGDLMVNVKTDITSPDVVIFALLLQLVILFIIKLLLRKNVNDRSYQFV